MKQTTVQNMIVIRSLRCGHSGRRHAGHVRCCRPRHHCRQLPAQLPSLRPVDNFAAVANPSQQQSCPPTRSRRCHALSPLYIAPLRPTHAPETAYTQRRSRPSPLPAHKPHVRPDRATKRVRPLRTYGGAKSFGGVFPDVKAAHWKQKGWFGMLGRLGGREHLGG